MLMGGRAALVSPKIVGIPSVALASRLEPADKN
jgi:hypothetical protein